VAQPAKAESKQALPPVVCSDAERHELIGFATAQGQHWQQWALDTLQAAARRSATTVLVEFAEPERVAVERTAKSCGLAVPAFIRRAAMAGVRRIGMRG